MLPAISAEDCLYADLGIDPGRERLPELRGDRVPRGAAADRRRAYLILWQISVVGERRAVTSPRHEGLAVLTEALLAHYPPEHEVVVYEASPYPVADAIVRRLPLSALAGRAGDADGDARRSPRQSGDLEPARGDRVALRLVERAGLGRCGGSLALATRRA